MNTRALWAEGVPDLYAEGRLNEANEFLTAAEVSSRTGLAVSTITDLLSREPITEPSNPLRWLTRPQVRISNKPLYAPTQVARYLEQRGGATKRHLGGGSEPLPKVSVEEATRRNLLSVEQIAHMATPPVHEQTVRRWARDRQDFPRAVALRAREGGHPGVPIVVYPGREAAQWLREHGY